MCCFVIKEVFEICWIRRNKIDDKWFLVSFRFYVFLVKLDGFGNKIYFL